MFYLGPFTRWIEALIDSIIEPIFRWLLQRSLLVRVIALFGLILPLGFGYIPGCARFVNELYFMSVDLAYSARHNKKSEIPLSQASIAGIKKTIARLEETVIADLRTIPARDTSLTPWSASQALLALAPTKVDPTIVDGYSKLLSRSRIAGCFCWTEIVGENAEGTPDFITAWILAATPGLNWPVSATDLSWVTQLQSSHGWWPTFPDTASNEYASVYSTAWFIIGLKSLLQSSNLPADKTDDLLQSVRGGAAWVLQARNGARWKPYPNNAGSMPSESVSGLALHSLHVSGAVGLDQIDRAWLASLPNVPPTANDMESPYFEMHGSGPERIEHFQQLKLPWMLIATVDAFSHGSRRERAHALKWINDAVNQDSVVEADGNPNNWWRAELLISLKYMSAQASKAGGR